MKSRVPEIVEPKQLIQSRVLVKRARQKGRQVSNTRHSQAFDTRLPKRRTGVGKVKRKSQQADGATGVGSLKESGEHQS